VKAALHFCAGHMPHVHPAANCSALSHLNLRGRFQGHFYFSILLTDWQAAGQKYVRQRCLSARFFRAGEPLLCGVVAIIAAGFHGHEAILIFKGP
jgi:hypothetical protein